MDEADEAAGPLVAGDLRVPGVVAYEGRTRAEYGEHRGEEQNPPGAAEQDDAGDHAGQGERVEGDDARVPVVAASQEALALDLAQ
ncbi:hypothetical protein SGLAM104S_04202 [Streptomyces glaucescens]